MASETLTLRGRIVTGSRSVDDGLIAVGGDRIVFAGPAAEYGGPGAEGASPAADFGGPAADFAGPAADPVGPAADPSSAIDANVNPAGTTPREYLLLPGLVDLHCHGAGGNDFSEGSPDGARAAAGFLHSRGSTTLLASLVTASQPDLVRNLNALRSLADKGLIAGMHLEGPFLSPEHHGAHDPGLLREPDPLVVGELLEAAGPWLTSVTYAAELRGAVELVDQLAGNGVIPSLGHTGADAATASDFLERAFLGLQSAVESEFGRPRAGNPEAAETSGFMVQSDIAAPPRRPTVTHLFNAMPVLHHRAPGPVAAALSAAAAGRAVVELIADGVHLAPATVKMVFDLVGADNIALVTDSMAATGLQDGQYRLGSLAVTVLDGVARVDGTGAIAGGTATLLDVVRTAVAAGVPLQDAVRSATAVPAGVLGGSGDVGDLAAGMRADVLVVDEQLTLVGVLRGGEWVHPLS